MRYYVSSSHSSRGCCLPIPRFMAPISAALAVIYTIDLLLSLYSGVPLWLAVLLTPFILMLFPITMADGRPAADPHLRNARRFLESILPRSLATRTHHPHRCPPHRHRRSIHHLANDGLVLPPRTGNRTPTLRRNPRLARLNPHRASPAYADAAREPRATSSARRHP